MPAFIAYAKGEEVDATVPTQAYQDIVTELAQGLEERAKIMHDTRYKEMVEFTGDKMALFKRLGWASAGSVYHTMSNVQAELVKTLQTPITVSKGNHWTNDKFQLNKAEYIRYKKQVLSVIASYKLPQAFREGENATIEDYFKKAGWNTKMVIEFIQWLAKTDNTMEAFSSLGHYMLEVSFAALGIILAISWVSPGVGQALSTMSLMFCSPLIVGGALLAYYVPAIPFLIWTAGLIGWFIVVIEALVAAPLWVLGISRVDGEEGFLGRHGREGLFLFLSVLTRPFGMLFGLCIAMTVMTFVDKLLIGLFSLFIVDTDTMQDSFEIPFVSMFVYLFILSATRTTFVHKIFGLVSYLPDVLVGWIGARGQSLSDKQDEQTVSGVVRQSAGHLALASQSTGNAVTYKANAQAKKDAAKEKDQLNNSKDNGGGKWIE